MLRPRVNLLARPQLRPQISPSRVIRAEVFALSPRELESYFNTQANENICLQVSWGEGGTRGGNAEWIYAAPSRKGIREWLADELTVSLPPRLASKTRLLVDELDGLGFMPLPLEELASLLDVSAPSVRQMLNALVQIDPGGLGSSDLPSFIIWQLDHLPDSAELGLARRLVVECFEMLARLDLHRAARRLGCPFAELVAVYTGVIARLRPYPLALAEEPALEADPCACFCVGENGTLRWESDSAAQLRVSVVPYRTFLAGEDSEMDTSFRRGLVDDNGRARALVRALQERQHTLTQLLDDVLLREDTFLRGMKRFPVGITQSACAARLARSPSLFSRLVRANSVVLVSGEIVNLATFFKPQGKLRNAIWEELKPGGTAAALSDSQLAAQLVSRGIWASRRTVAKYRQKLGLDNSYLRCRRADIKKLTQEETK